MRFRLLLTSCIICLAGAIQAGIPFAGIYEGADKNLAASRQMYVVLDFMNGTPDFTQQFTTKESTFKVLPKDFMNAKKLTKAFAGSKAAGFSRYRNKVLFTNWEEMRLTNPRVRGALIVCDWEDALSRKGKCAIMRLPNDSITIIGLSAMDPSISPNWLRLELVKNLLPDSKMPIPVLSTENRAKMRKLIDEDPINRINIIDDMFKDEPNTEPGTSTPDGNKPSANKPGATSGQIKFPVLWREDGPTLYECHIEDIGGDFGRFVTDSSLDFWGDATVVKGAEIAARWIYTCQYDNGRRYEGEYIYYGNKQGNKLVLTHRFNSGEQGYHSTPKIEKLEKPEIITSPDGKSLLFQDMTFKRTY